MDLNLNKLNQKIRQAFEETVEDYSEQCRAELTAEKWPWPRKTQRQNGDVVGSPRDRVDSEELVNSQQEPAIEEPNGEIVGTIEWTAEHAALVHDGEVNEGVIYPGTPWTQTALAAMPLDQQLAKNLRKKLK